MRAISSVLHLKFYLSLHESKNCFVKHRWKLLKLYSGDKLHRNTLYCSDQPLWEQSLLWKQTLCKHTVLCTVWICGSFPYCGDKHCVNLWEHSTLWRQTLCKFVGTFYIVETNCVNLWEHSTLWRQTFKETLPYHEDKFLSCFSSSCLSKQKQKKLTLFPSDKTNQQKVKEDKSK